MGMVVVTACKACRKVAPSLGDGGFIGFPTLTATPVQFEGGLQSFGYIYSGFEAIGLVTLDLFSFSAFLRNHAGHQVVTAADEAIDLEFGEAFEEDEDDEIDELPEGWVTAHFEVRCRTCRKRRRTEGVESFQERPAQAVSQAQVELFADRVLPLVEDNMYRCEPFDDRELGALANFLKRHKEHELSSRIAAADE